MKKIFYIMSVLAMIGIAHAQTYQPFNPPGGLSMKTLIGTTSQKLSDVASLANGALPAKNGVRTGGSDNGTDIGSAMANGVLLAKAVGQARSHYKIFMGSVSQMSAIAGDVTNSLSTGAIALYLHANGLAGLTSAQRQAIQSVWGAGGASILTGGGTAVGEVGSDIPDAGYLALFGGKYPQEVNVDLPTSVVSTTYTATSTDAKPGTTYQNYLDAATEKQMETNFDGIISKAGTYNIAPFYTMQYDTDDDFATGAYYANYRKLALYSGGFAVDAPPQFYLGTGSTLLDKTAAMIKWGTDNHLRVFLLVTPFTNGAQNCGYQSDFLQSTQTFVSYLRTKGAVPTEYGAANYCGNTTNTVVNAPRGDDVPQSVNQVALWLATQPVSDAGTVTPASPGGLSQAQLEVTKAMSNGVLADTSYSGVPTTTVPVNILRNNLPNKVTAFGDMAYQNSYIIDIKAGTIGRFDMTHDPLHVYLNANSSFQTAAPLLFQGYGDGNTYLGGGGNGPWLHLWNPYTTDLSKTGLIWGTEDTDPSILRYGKGLGVNGSLFGNGGDSANLFSQGWENAWNLSNGNGETDYINVKGGASLPGGFRWYDKLGSQLAVTLSPLMSLDTSGLSVSGAISGSGNGSANTISNGWKLAWNVSNGTGETDLINARGSASIPGGFRFYNKIPSDNTPTLNPLMTLTGYGDETVQRGYIVTDMTKASILAIVNPAEGTLVNDSDDHVPVIYENGHWYPVQLGTALQ